MLSLAPGRWRRSSSTTTFLPRKNCYAAHPGALRRKRLTNGAPPQQPWPTSRLPSLSSSHIFPFPAQIVPPFLFRVGFNQVGFWWSQHCLFVFIKYISPTTPWPRAHVAFLNVSCKIGVCRSPRQYSNIKGETIAIYCSSSGAQSYWNRTWLWVFKTTTTKCFFFSGISAITWKSTRPRTEDSTASMVFTIMEKITSLIIWNM